MTERFEIVEKALIQMLEEKKYATLRDILATMNPADVAAIFSELSESALPLLFRLLPHQDIGVSPAEAGRYIDSYLETYSGVKNYMDNIKKKAKEDGMPEAQIYESIDKLGVLTLNIDDTSFIIDPKIICT